MKKKAKAPSARKVHVGGELPETFGLEIFDALKDEMLVVCPDTFKIIAANAAAKRRDDNVSADDIIGKKLWEHFSGITEKDAIADIEPLLSDDVENVDLHALLQNDDQSNQDVKLHIRKYRYAAQSALIVTSTLTARDHDTERLAYVALNIPKSVLLYDLKGRIVWANKGFSRQTGYELDEIKGKKASKLLHGPETNERTVEYIRSKLKSGRNVHTELIIYHKSGKKIWSDIHVEPAFKPDGKPEYYILTASDITERKRIEESARKLNKELAEEKERFELAVIGSDNGIWDWDIISDTAYYSSRFRELLGYEKEEFPDDLKSFPEIIHPDDAERAKKVVENHLQNQVPYDLEYRLKTKDGSYRWFRSKGQALWDELGNPVRMAGSITDISEHKKNEYAIKHLAKTDALTGLPNRTLFHEQLSNAIAQAKRNGNKVGVMLLDLDHFKDINDTMGHPAGDALLREVSRRILACVRETDTVTRLGGDEFAIVATNLNEPADIKHLATRIVNELAEPFDIDSQKVHSGASIGITVYPESTGSSDDLLRNADVALYSAKGAGRGTYKIYDGEMNKRVQARRIIERDLRIAMDREELEVYYQPQIELSTMKIVGAEALLRWTHPERGTITPGEFIPVAEASRMIIPLGEWVLNTACQQNRKWQQEGLPPIVVAVNVSPLQFKHQDMLPNLFEAVAASGLDPKWLEVEITEAVAMENGAVRVLNELKDFGVNLSIDDFGTGYSSLSRLKNFPVDRLKIDRSFVRSIEKQLDHAAVGTAIIQLGHALGLNVIAEGVETLEELQHLNIMGCDSVQGYLFGRPMPAAQFAEFLRLHSPKFHFEENQVSPPKLVTAV